MVNAPAAADAVRRARTMPNLHVGLHLVLIEGQAALPHTEIPGLVDARGRFGSDQIGRSFGYFCRPTLRRQLAAEIDAQFSDFAATGLSLHHADAHKHMHLHPTVARLMIDAGARYGLSRLRVPAEPPSVLTACGERPGLGARALFRWASVLRHQARRAGLATSDQVFGIAWTGHVTAARLLRLCPLLPQGHTEIYLHPATRTDATLARTMASYAHEAELAALCDQQVIEAYAKATQTKG
jgi:hopanoid biosynthesis associated protein HpnK